MFERYTVTMCSSGPVNSSNTVLITILPLKLAILIIIIPTVAGGGLISHVCVFLSVCLSVCLQKYFVETWCHDWAYQWENRLPFGGDILPDTDSG